MAVAVRSPLAQPLPLGYCNPGVVKGVNARVEPMPSGDRAVSNRSHAEIVGVGANIVGLAPPGGIVRPGGLHSARGDRAARATPHPPRVRPALRALPRAPTHLPGHQCIIESDRQGRSPAPARPRRPSTFLPGRNLKEIIVTRLCEAVSWQ